MGSYIFQANFHLRVIRYSSLFGEKESLALSLFLLLKERESKLVEMNIIQV